MTEGLVPMKSDTGTRRDVRPWMLEGTLGYKGLTDPMMKRDGVGRV
jgi:hypothetical protein